MSQFPSFALTDPSYQKMILHVISYYRALGLLSQTVYEEWNVCYAASLAFAFVVVKILLLLRVFRIIPVALALWESASATCRRAAAGPRPS